jgi:hypothetical protein
MPACQANSPRERVADSSFHRSSQLFIRVHNQTLSVVVLRVRSFRGIFRWGRWNLPTKKGPAILKLLGLKTPLVGAACIRFEVP